MGATTFAESPANPSDEATLLAQARAVHAKLGDTFERLLHRFGLTRGEFAAHVRGLERVPASRRALEAARHDDLAPPRGRAALVPTPPSLPRNPRALRV